MKRKTRKCFGNRGFTLIELIIVIAIMAILVGVLAPNFLRYLHQARVERDTQLMDTLRTAVQASLADPDVAAAKIGGFILLPHPAMYGYSDGHLYTDWFRGSDDTLKKVLLENLGYSSETAMMEGLMSEISAVDALGPGHQTDIYICVNFDTMQVYTSIFDVGFTEGKPRMYAMVPAEGCPDCRPYWESSGYLDHDWK